MSGKPVEPWVSGPDEKVPDETLEAWAEEAAEDERERLRAEKLEEEWRNHNSDDGPDEEVETCT